MATGEGAGTEGRRRIEALRSTSLFAGCTDDELRRVDAMADEIEVDADEMVVAADAPLESTFVVLDGGLVAVVGDEMVARIGRGDWFGGAGSSVPDVAAVRAVVESRLLVIDPTARAALSHPCDERSGT